MDVENRLVKKSNSAISSRVKGYSLNQMKIMNLAISELTEHTTANDILSFQAVDLLKAIGLGENNHTELRKATLDMIRGIEIPESDGSFTQVPVFKRFKYHKGGAVEIQFDADVLPLLVQAKTEYTKYYFQNIQRLKSGYSIKIYELCKQYQNTKQGYRDLTINDLKNYLDIPKTKYKLFGHFKSRVIEPQLKEINDKTDLVITLGEPIKSGRRITGVRFYISVKNKEKEEQPKLPYELEELSPAGHRAVQDYLLSPKVAVELQILATTDEHFIFAMDKFNKKIDAKYKKNETIENLPRYAEIALKNDIPVIVLSGVVEKEKAKAEEKNHIAEVNKKQAKEKEKAQQKTKELDGDFNKFCSRPDLLDVLKYLDLKEILSLELTGENESIMKFAKKQSNDIFAKSIVDLSSIEIVEILTGTVKGFTMSKPKTTAYKMLKIYMKSAFKYHF
jgi:plasmid replication initiation protein